MSGGFSHYYPVLKAIEEGEKYGGDFMWTPRGSNCPARIEDRLRQNSVSHVSMDLCA